MPIPSLPTPSTTPVTSTDGLVTVTPIVTDDPCPRCEIVVTAGSAVQVSVLRIWGDSQVGNVRGAVQAPAAGDFLVVDYEAPFGVAVSYYAVLFAADGSTTQTEPAGPVQLAVPDVWLQDPLDPQTSVAVGVSQAAGVGPWLGAGSLGSMTFSADLTVSPVAGGTLPFAVSGPRRDAAAVPFVIRSPFGADTDAVAAIMQRSPVLMRTPPQVQLLSGVTYVVAQDVVGSPDLVLQRVEWTFTATSVAGPGVAIVVAVRVWDDLLDEADTWNALAALYSTWTDLERGP